MRIKIKRLNLPEQTNHNHINQLRLDLISKCKKANKTIFDPKTECEM